jgi:hypothetical protein
VVFDTEWEHREIAEEIALANKKNGVIMRMTSPEKLIIENQMQIMMALSVVLQHFKEVPAALAVSTQVSKTSVVLHGAKTWPE